MAGVTTGLPFSPGGWTGPAGMPSRGQQTQQNMGTPLPFMQWDMAFGPGMNDPMRQAQMNPHGGFEKMLSQGVMGGQGGMAAGKVAGPPELMGGGGGGLGAAFGDMSPLEKMFLITSGAGAVADIGTGIYDRVKQSRREREERDRKDRTGRTIGDRLSSPGGPTAPSISPYGG